MTNYSDMKYAVELLSGGANTVMFDDVGLPSIMVIIPKMLSSDLIDGATETPHPGFMYSEDGAVEKVAVSKYVNVVINNRAYSLPFKDPATKVSYDEAILFCRNKGRRWGLMPYSLWAAIALWCRKNSTLPHGNTNQGHDINIESEKGSLLTGENYVYRTATGSGPVTWFHNHTLNGIADMVGNVAEWCAGLRLVDGEIQIIKGSNCVYSNFWQGIDNNGNLVNIGSNNSLKFDIPTANSELSITCDNPQDLGTTIPHLKKITNVTTNLNIWDNQLLKELVLIRPDNSNFPDSYYQLSDFLGTKYPTVGGYYSSGITGDIYNKSFEFTNSHKQPYIGFRSVYYGL